MKNIPNNQSQEPPKDQQTRNPPPRNPITNSILIDRISVTACWARDVPLHRRRKVQDHDREEAVDGSVDANGNPDVEIQDGEDQGDTGQETSGANVVPWAPGERCKLRVENDEVGYQKVDQEQDAGDQNEG